MREITYADSPPHDRLYMWTPEKIRWYARACDWPENDCCRILANAILERLPEKPVLCELGCGIGALSLQLADKARFVTAVDINTLTIDHLCARVSADNVRNVHPLKGNFRRLTPPVPHADGVVMCKVGHLAVHLDNAMRWTREKLFFITSANNRRSFHIDGDKPPCPEVESLYSFLDQAEFLWEETFLQIRLDQPLESRDEAARFLKAYNPSEAPAELSAFLDERLITTDCSDYPYCLPCRKDYVMITVKKAKSN
ncbi:MAG: class I SAM-dependent methyltransferase [Clostridia bacterium]|nr:class I SAM-dependent methyltransferase [Clostridia bacterium]